MFEFPLLVLILVTSSHLKLVVVAGHVDLRTRQSSLFRCDKAVLHTRERKNNSFGI